MTLGSLHREPLPPAPAYGTGSIGEVLTSAAASLGVDGFTNELKLPSARRICVVMVDGLGRELLKRRGGHAPFLRSHLDAGLTLSSAFPSTTAASLATLGTGRPPGQHGMVGYDVLDPEQLKVVNMLNAWDAGVDPLRWQPYPTVLERVNASLPVITVSEGRFADSPMTKAALRGGQFIAAGSVQARVRTAVEQLAAHESILMYVYLNDLDKAGHRYGCDSSEWVSRLEDLDAALRSLASRVPPDTLLLVTADHGMVDVPAEQRIDFSAEPGLVDGVAYTAGEPRMVHLYCEDGLPELARERLRSRWQQAYGPQAWILTRGEAISAGYFGAVDEGVRPRIGDLIIAAREPVAFYDLRRVSATALEMVGQHGSLTRAEREVPLLTLNTPPRQRNRTTPVGTGARG